MPKQSRGFWFCSYCEQAFDQYEEADFHEKHTCTAVARGPVRHQQQQTQTARSSTTMVSTASVDPIPPVWHPQQHHQQHAVAPYIPADPTYHSRYVKPYPESTIDPYARGMAPISELGSDQRMMMTPYDSHVPIHMQQPMQQQLRYLPILGSQEPSTLNETDTLACRSLELFEVLTPDSFDEDIPNPTVSPNQQQRKRPLSVLQVGIRCAFCAEYDTTTESYIFPANTRSIGDSIRHAGFDHLLRCTHYPNQYKQQIKEVLWKRNDRAASGQPEDPDEEAQRRALIHYCVTKCSQVGIVDRHPAGMIFANPAGGMEGALPPPPPYMVPPYHPGPVGPYGYPPKVEEQSTQQYSERAYGGRPRSTQKQQVQQHQRKKSETREDDAPSTTDPNSSVQHPPHYPQHVYPYVQSPPPQQSMMMQEFPFYYEHNRWVCKYCSHLPQSYRDPQYYWQESVHVPPPPHLMDYHLSICREFQRSMMYEQSLQPPVYGRDAVARTGQLEPRQTMLSSPLYGPAGWEQPESIGPTPPRVSGGAEYRSPSDVLDSPYATPQFNRQQTRPGDPARPLQQLPPQQHQGAAASTTATSSMVRASVQRDPPPHDDIAVVRAIDHLDSLDQSHYTEAGGNILKEEDRLVVDEDRLLLTDYFYYLMKQLRPVRFSEADRRTRGGKRENVRVGYGGLQCIHCIDVPNSRKFFWSNVDRLANSFAEIPTHVLKCRRCPQATKDALLVLKNRHAEQMSRLSRGSQKVFFRRMWRRLHQEDANTGTPNEVGSGVGMIPVDYLTPLSFRMQQGSGNVSQQTYEGTRPPPLDTAFHSDAQTLSEQKEESDISPSGTSGSEESVYFLQRPTHEAAKILLDSYTQRGPPSPSSRVLLAIPEDREWLSDTDCFVRRQLEVFCATSQDVEAAIQDRKYPISEGQVGIRCIHCAMSNYGARGPAVAYPFSISGLFESTREIERMHLGYRDNVGSRDNMMITCENLPLSAKEKLESLKGAASSLSSVLRKYFVLAAKALGLRDTVDGIRVGGEPIPIGTQAPLVFTDSSESIEEMPTTETEKVDTQATQESMIGRSATKRKAEDVSMSNTEPASHKIRRTVAVLRDDHKETASSQGSSRISASRGISILAKITADQDAATSQVSTVKPATENTSTTTKDDEEKVVEL